jgi:hypothetical protein
VRWHIAAHYSTSSDHCTFTNSHVRQDHTVRPNENVPFNNNLSVTFWSSGPRVKVGDYRRSEADCTVVPDCYVRGMYFINVYKLANPDVISDHNSAEPLQPRSQPESPRGHKSYPARKPTNQQWQPQRLKPLDLRWCSGMCLCGDRISTLCDSIAFIPFIPFENKCVDYALKETIMLPTPPLPQIPPHAPGVQSHPRCASGPFSTYRNTERFRSMFSWTATTAENFDTSPFFETT